MWNTDELKSLNMHSCSSSGNSVYPGSKLFRIHERALEACRSLCRLVIPIQLQIIDLCALLNCESLRELIVETPSNLKQLDLPSSNFGSLCIPDTVEVVRGSIGSLDDQSTLLQFGRESSLNESNLNSFERVSLMSTVGEAGNQVFARLSEDLTRRFRCTFEEF
jgi:hypothetical protein